MRTAVINLSHPHYNLGAEKLANWLSASGNTVERFDRDPGLFVAGFDLVCLSAIFSWDAIGAVELAARAQAGAEVWAGGPGFQHTAEWFRAQTGVTPHFGLDPRFEHQRGSYRMTYAARGCPWDCHFCGVTRWEGKQYTPDWDFQPAPILCDNNLTDEPIDFQEHIVERYRQTGTRLLDANSGFEPRNFTEETYRRWKPLLRGPWRFAYDYLPERSAALRMLRTLKGESPKKKRVYVLIGNEPFETCLQRATEVIEHGGEPYCQPYLNKAARDRRDFVMRYDWTPDRLTHFARYFNRYLWKYTPLAAYRCGNKQPFALVS